MKGLYLVISPAQERSRLLKTLQIALNEGLAAVQIYNDSRARLTEVEKIELSDEIAKQCAEYRTPCLINNDYRLLEQTKLDGVHFDTLPEEWPAFKKRLSRPVITGLTLSNDLTILTKIKTYGIDYLSFCSMFPSKSVDTCDIVNPENVRKAYEETGLPIFLSGGITPDNSTQFNDLNISGVAVISGVMNADDPTAAVRKYNQLLAKTITT